MSERQPIPRAVAMKVAEEMLKRLRMWCDRIAIVGSLRREKAEVSDVELLMVPHVVMRKDGLFEETEVNLLDGEIERLLTMGVLTKRLSKIGVPTWGKLNRLGVHKSGIPVDLFSTSSRNWWMSLVIRTGPKVSNLRLIAAAADRGLQLHAYGVYERIGTGTEVVPQSEREVFELAGVAYKEPKNR